MGELGDKVEGNVKDTGGKVTGDKKMEWEGKAQKAKGNLEGAGREMTGKDPVTDDEPVEGDSNP
ncbi:MAG TPA: CsbD family protein [Candidatus Dormibacteraeota bacterium]|jgi:uncharacterized protein YjbJ (UPF0337 family)|nr:CsbD family protein [Candidatus Dormibacteraeota bacterium]